MFVCLDFVLTFFPLAAKPRDDIGDNYHNIANNSPND